MGDAPVGRGTNPGAWPARLFCAALAVSWLVMMLYAWTAFSTLPSPERLESSRMVSLPTYGTIARLAMVSAVELAVLLVLTWPAPRRRVTRLLVAMLALPVWFFATTPLTLTTVEWVHRRWLAAVWLALLAALVITLMARMATRPSSHVRTTSPEGE